MALNVVRNVLSYSEVVDTVNSAGSVERLLNSVTLNVRVVNDSDQMEVNRIPTKLEGLPYIEELNVLNPGYQVLHAIGMHHDLGTILILGRGLGISSIEHISGEEADFGTGLDPVGAGGSEALDARVVLELERSVDGDQRLLRVSVVDGCDDSLLSLSVEVAGGCDDNALADLPVDVSD